MACRVGEPVKGSAGGWLGRRPKLWRLQYNMHPMAEVSALDSFPAIKYFPDCLR